MFGVDSVPPTDSPYATDLERAIVNGLPRSRSEIWRLHLMAWHRLNDGLRFEPLENPTSPAMDKPIRGYVAAALLKDMPNRRPLTRILRIDVLRQIGKFAQARKSAETMIAGLGVVKSLGEWESNRRNEIYRIFLNGQLTLTERGDRLPRPIELTQCQRNVWYETRKEADQCRGTDETLRPRVEASLHLWRRIERFGWTCHNCGRGGRAYEDFTYDGRAKCRHCGWPQ
jgi:hypothetical protein